MNQDQKTFWSTTSLKKKIEIWSNDQIRNFFVPLIDLKPNELIYDLGSGFSPLGLSLLPFILPHGTIKGFDIEQETVTQATAYAQDHSLSKMISFSQADVYQIDELELPLADVVMCQQLLVNLPDPIAALEHMMNVTKSTGRILCIENVNYGAYVYRPDFSWRTNLKLSRIWQQLCIAGKFGFDHGDTTFGANLPQVFHKLGLQDISWQIISSGVNAQPPYSEDFKRNFLEKYDEEKARLIDLVLHSWGPKTKLSPVKLQFFVNHLVANDYDRDAVENDLFLTSWFYPFMAIVGWIKQKEKKPISEEVQLQF